MEVMRQHNPAYIADKDSPQRNITPNEFIYTATIDALIYEWYYWDASSLYCQMIAKDLVPTLFECSDDDCHEPYAKARACDEVKKT